jgi:ABC-type antimicrobial peptide transport system permease subunit
VLRASTGRERFLGALLGVFALMALIIAAVGVHAVVSFTVARQSREFAIRSALGARRRGILVGVLRTNSLVAGAGALAGVVAVLVAAPGMRAFLFNVAPRDALVLTVVPLALLAVALLSSLVPAVHATRIPPAQVLQDGE